MENDGKVKRTRPAAAAFVVPDPCSRVLVCHRWRCAEKALVGLGSDDPPHTARRVASIVNVDVEGGKMQWKVKLHHPTMSGNQQSRVEPTAGHPALEAMPGLGMHAC